jgi:hypothetical protein
MLDSGALVIEQSQHEMCQGGFGYGATSPSGRVSVKDPSPPNHSSAVGGGALVNRIHPIELNRSAVKENGEVVSQHFVASMASR